jgi:predicted ATP-dependent protease
VQAVGGVNEKVETYFDLCAARDLDSTQLMLRDEVVAAVAAGRFSVHAAHSVDDALELLTGLPAGDALAWLRYPVLLMG